MIETEHLQKERSFVQFKSRQSLVVLRRKRACFRERILTIPIQFNQRVQRHLGLSCRSSFAFIVINFDNSVSCGTKATDNCEISKRTHTKLVHETCCCSVVHSYFLLFPLFYCSFRSRTEMGVCEYELLFISVLNTKTAKLYEVKRAREEKIEEFY